jgi:chromate transporter
MAALTGLLFAPLMIVLALAILFGGVADSPTAQGALKGMGAVSAGLIIATGLKLSTTLPQNPMGMKTAILFAVLSFACVGIFRFPLIWALLGLGVVSCFITYYALKQLQTKLDANLNRESNNKSSSEGPGS